MQSNSFSAEKDIRFRPIRNKNQGDERNEKEIYPQWDRPYHVPRDSLFSSLSEHRHLRGLFNTIIVLLITSAISTVCEKGMRLVCLTFVFRKVKMVIDNPSESPTPFIVLGLNIFIILSFVIEMGYAKVKLTEKVGRVLIILHLSALLFIPAFLFVYLDSNTVVATLGTALTIITFLKLVSYHIVNYWCRSQTNYLETAAVSNNSTPEGVCSEVQRNYSKSSLVVYPNNVYLKDLYYFIFIPSLNYHLNFPRSNCIRKKFVIARIIEMLVLPEAVFILYEQWITPILGDVSKFQEKDATYIIKILLKLVVPHHFFVMTAFYLMFHTFFNLISELMKFADREFYKDWWNAESFGMFWRRWNIPVHQWCRRHLYKPLLLHGFSNHFANMTVFLVSAFFHEYLFSISTKCMLIWPFFFILSQIPLILIVDWYHLKKFGNLAIWIFFISLQQIFGASFYQYYYIHFIETA